MSHTYHAVLMKTAMGYSAHCPELHGCWSQGRTEDEALANIKDAIEIHLVALKRMLRKKNVFTIRVPG